MTDLSDSGLAKWWGAKPPRLLAAVVRQEAKESWTLDHDGRFVELVVAVGAAMTKSSGPAEAMAKLHSLLADPVNLRSMRLALAYMSARRRLRLLSALFANEQWAGGKRQLADLLLNGQALPLPDEEIAAVNAIRASLDDFRQRHMLEQLFSPDRLRSVRTAVTRARSR